MTSDTTDPDNVADVNDHATALFRDSRTTDLTAAEGRSLARSRKVAFCCTGRVRCLGDVPVRSTSGICGS